jgi:hypothetical protein
MQVAAAAVQQIQQSPRVLEAQVAAAQEVPIRVLV